MRVAPGAFAAHLGDTRLHWSLSHGKSHKNRQLLKKSKKYKFKVFSYNGYYSFFITLWVTVKDYALFIVCSFYEIILD